MIKLAFCDHEPAALQKLAALADRYRAERDPKIEYVMFQSPLELLFKIECGVRFDVIILETLMPGENGVDAAAEIRSKDSNVKIIFLTNSPDFAVQSYEVGAFYYQLKPMRSEVFFKLMDTVAAQCREEREHSLVLRCKHGISRIEARKLEYCEVIHRTLFIHMKNGEILESVGSLDDLTRLLQPMGGFYRIHRSYLVNLEYIASISYRAVNMTCGTELPLPRGKCSELKEAFLAYARRNWKVMV